MIRTTHDHTLDLDLFLVEKAYEFCNILSKMAMQTQKGLEILQVFNQNDQNRTTENQKRFIFLHEIDERQLKKTKNIINSARFCQKWSCKIKKA